MGQYAWYIYYVETLIVMRSREISCNSDMRHFQFSIKCSFGEVHFAETPPELVQWFQGYEQLIEGFSEHRKQ